jgi:adenine/guanine phosphoribosyltransferase-like PRPP-binding protein
VFGVVLLVVLLIVGVIVVVFILKRRHTNRNVLNRSDKGGQLMLSNISQTDAQGMTHSRVGWQCKMFGKTCDNATTWTSRTFTVHKQRDIVKCIEHVVEHLQQKGTDVDAVVGMNTNENPEDMLGAALALKLQKPFVSVESTLGETAGDDVIRHTYQYHNKKTVIEVAKKDCKPNQKVIIVDCASTTLSRTDAVIALIQQTGAKVVECFVLGRDRTTRPPVWSLFRDRSSGRNDDIVMRNSAEDQPSINI